MIKDILHNAALYSALGPRFRAAFDYLQRTDLTMMPGGKYELEKIRLFVLVQEYTTKMQGQGMWEAHRRYIDVQYMVRGSEIICHAPLIRAQQREYDESKDFLALSAEGDALRMHAGDFAIFFPEDAHMPCMSMDQPMDVKKAVVKIAVDG